MRWKYFKLISLRCYCLKYHIPYHFIIFLQNHYSSVWHQQQKRSMRCLVQMLIIVTLSSVFHFNYTVYALYSKESLWHDMPCFFFCHFSWVNIHRQWNNRHTCLSWPGRCNTNTGRSTSFLSAYTAISSKYVAKNVKHTPWCYIIYNVMVINPGWRPPLWIFT